MCTNWKKCSPNGGVGIGGVLEPLQAAPRSLEIIALLEPDQKLLRVLLLEIMQLYQWVCISGNLQKYLIEKLGK